MPVLLFSIGQFMKTVCFIGQSLLKIFMFLFPTSPLKTQWQ